MLQQRTSISLTGLARAFTGPRMLRQTMLALVAMMLMTGMFMSVGVNQASAASGPWYASAGSRPPTTQCTINANATATTYMKYRWNGYKYVWSRALKLQVNTDIHNPYVFVGCSIRVIVEVVRYDGVTMATAAGTATAYAVFDPRGSDRFYTWYFYPSLYDGAIDQISGLRIRFANT